MRPPHEADDLVLYAGLGAWSVAMRERPEMLPDLEP
jgi:hypothetical protein